MAYLNKKINRVGKVYYYSIVQSVNWYKPMRISLKTSDISEAEQRHQEVEDYEKGLKRGQRYKWSWENNCGNKTRIVKSTIGKLINQWLEIKKTNVSIETYKRYRVSLNAFVDVICKTSSISAINNQTIENFKKFYKAHHTNVGININLRGIKAFLRWASEEGHIKKVPKIVMMPVPKSKPKYINQKHWKAMMQIKGLSKWWKDVFTLYRSTGMRRSEPIHGYIEGEFFIVPAEFSKTRHELEILLNEWQIDIVRQIHQARDQHLEKGSKMVTFKNKFTKKFQDACKEIGIYEPRVTKLHCLRHTFAVMRYLETRDLYQVCKELNHTSITTTEIYAQFSFKRLEQDFAKKDSTESDIESKKYDLDTRNVDTQSYINYNSRLLN